MDRTPSPRRLIVLAGLCSLAPWTRAGAYDDFFIDIRRDYAAGVERWLQRGFDPNSVDPAGQPALVVAMQHEARRVVDVLLRAPGLRLAERNPAGETALMIAALRGEIDWAAKLIVLGAPVEQPGWAPLHYAATGTSQESRRIAEMLVDRGAGIDARSPNGSTPLMLAARYGTEPMVELLLLRGADRRLRNERGLDAAEFARGAGRDALAARLEAPR